MECIFCRIAEGEAPTEILHKDEEIVAFRDLNPQAPTHIVVVPRKHIPTVNDLSGEDASLVGRLFLRAKELAAAEGIDQSGYRTVVNCQAGAGQSVFHLHLHLLGGRAMRWPPG